MQTGGCTQSVFGKRQKYYLPVRSNHCLTAGKRWEHLWDEREAWRLPAPLSEIISGHLSRWETAARPGSTRSAKGCKNSGGLEWRVQKCPRLPDSVSGRLRVRCVSFHRAALGNDILLRTEQIIIQGAVNWHRKALLLTVSSSFGPPPWQD